MITEDYVSFETAKLLKEKGFKHWCYKSYGDAVYHKGTPISFDEECELKDEGLEDEIEYVEGGYLYDFGYDNRKEEAKAWAAPTLQMTMKWLREKYDLHIEITSIKPYGSDGNGHDIPLDGVIYHSNIVQNNKWIEIIKKFKSHNIACYSSYEEACEAAIKYCLKNLI